MLAIKKGGCANSKQVREIVIALRGIGALESPQGYYDLSIAYEDHEALKIDDTIIQVYEYVLPAERERVAQGFVPSAWGCCFHPRAKDAE